MVIDGLMLLMDKIASGDRSTPAIVKPHADPVGERLVTLNKKSPRELEVGPAPRTRDDRENVPAHAPSEPGGKKS
jgi:hypothetical protein